MTDVSSAEDLTLQLTPALAAALDRYIAESGVVQDRAGAMVQVFREWAMAQGYLSADDGGLRPDQLNAANDG